MKKRIYSAMFIVLFIVATLLSRLITPFIFDAVIVFVGVLGSLEIAKSFIKARKPINEHMVVSMMFVSYIGILYMIFNKFAAIKILLYFLILIGAYFVLNFSISYFYKEKTKDEILMAGYSGKLIKYCFAKSLRTIFVLIYPTLLFSMLIMLNHIDTFFVMGLEEGAKVTSISILADFIIVATIVCSTFTDTFAMLVGCKVRGPKLCPKISPNKTISGAVAGWVFGIIGVLATYMLFSLSGTFIEVIEHLEIAWAPIILFAIIAPIMAQIGDLFASFIKRKHNIKDYSDVIPGHGGIMDRFDGLLFVVLVSFVFALINCL